MVVSVRDVKQVERSNFYTGWRRSSKGLREMGRCRVGEGEREGWEVGGKMKTGGGELVVDGWVVSGESAIPAVSCRVVSMRGVAVCQSVCSLGGSVARWILLCYLSSLWAVGRSARSVRGDTGE